ncbi:MAG: PfkB family carbohydrate kinase, partial [Capnocytophaga gingivalis]
LQDYIPKLPSHFLDASFVLLGNQHPQLQLEVLDQFVTPPSLIVSDTMNYWIDHSFEQLKEVIQKTDVLTVSDQEAFAITQEKVLLKAVEKLQQMGATYIIIKRGEHGAMLFHEDKSFYTPALPLCKVCDPTGAGDTFAGGFVGYMAQTGDISFENMKNGLVYATVLASFCVEEVGASKLLTINKEEVLRRLFSLKELTQFDIKVV